ncbi:hypothetical protein [Actinomadura roseirufa]|uniref:hypothetical protein n=1 Tax=Actinomadura roseirufa TaxID=2094049 RepID=UPI001040ECF4|nr:hypothetical protein [Actinomadura roseirufa]
MTDWASTSKARREALELQFPGVRAWYGKATSQWWALMPWHGMKEAFLVGGVDSIEKLGPLLLQELDRRGALAGSSAAAAGRPGTARNGGMVQGGRGGAERDLRSVPLPRHQPRGYGWSTQ